MGRSKVVKDAFVHDGLRCGGRRGSCCGRVMRPGLQLVQMFGRPGAGHVSGNERVRGEGKCRRR